jgi:hypothetical protein
VVTSGALQWSHHAVGAFYTAHREGDLLRLRLTGSPGRHQGAVTVSSNAGQTVVPVTADVVPHPQPAPEPHPVPRQSRPQPQPQPPSGPGPARQVDPGAQAAQTLAVIGLALSLAGGIGIVVVPWVLVMARRAERRIRGSGGWLEGADKARTARTLALVTIAVAVLSGSLLITRLVLSP